MPELPEVEVTRRGLEDVVGRRIRGINVTDEMLLGEGFDEPTSVESLTGNRVESVQRRGKYCLLVFEDSLLLFSLRMTGNLTVESDGEIGRENYVSLDLDDGALIFSSIRRFSKVHRYDTPDPEAVPKVQRLGIDPVHDELTVDAVRPLLENRTAPVKTLLMNQEIIAGLGNIYANEACHAAGIDPTRSVRTLDDDELSRLLSEIGDLLERAVTLGGSSINDFRGPDGNDGSFQDDFFVYGRDEEECVRCGSSLRKTELAGRSTFFCPECQQ
jgi:formamidopyrimidine-DNA glycosylase